MAPRPSSRSQDPQGRSGQMAIVLDTDVIIIRLEPRLTARRLDDLQRYKPISSGLVALDAEEHQPRGART